MKYFAIISVLILILALVFVGNLYMTSNVTVEPAGVTVVSAADSPELFAELAEQVRLGAVVGTPFVDAMELDSVENYRFITYTVTVRNNTRIPAELAEMQISPVAGADILQVGSFEDVAVPAHGTATLTATILTTASSTSGQAASVSYYMWGIPFNLKTRFQ